MTTYNASNASQLEAALNQCAGGDTIVLAAGDYGDVTIRNKNYVADVTIVSQSAGSPASLHSLSVVSSSHLHFDDLKVDFTPTASTYIFSPAVSINTASAITLTRGSITGGAAVNGVPTTATALDATSNVTGLPTGYGVSIQKSSGVTVDGVDISHLAKGVLLGASDNVVISHNEIHDLRTSGIVGSGLNHVTIDGNHIHDSNPWRWGQTPLGDHGDFIAFWTDTVPSTDIKIVNNLMEQGQGTAVLGMWLQGSATLGFTGAVIENNTILNGNFQGLTLWGTDGAKVDHNTFLQTSGDAKSAPSILLTDSASHVQVFENIVGVVNDKSAAAAGNTVVGNILAQKVFPDAAAFYNSDLASLVASLPDHSAVYAAAVAALNGDLAQRMAAEFRAAEAVGLAAAAGPQSITGTSADERLTGAGGNDTLDGAGGNDTLLGGVGDDTYFVWNTTTSVVEQPGQGTDTVIAKLGMTLPDNVENLTHNPNYNGDWTGIGNGSNNLITANGGSDLLDGRDGNDTLLAGSGSDTLVGGAGDDVLRGSTGKVVFDGGDGADTLVAGAGAATADGGAGDDSIQGGDATTYLRGGDGNDVIAGGKAFNDINGNQGNDTLYGGPANDWLVGGKGDDSIVGGTGNQILYGNLGNDTLQGGTGNDTLRGGQGDDVINGGGGADWISGDLGTNVLTGGAGADTFHIGPGGGIDQVTDFHAGEGDRVQLDAGSQYTVAQVGADTVISINGGAQMTLIGVDLSTLKPGWIFGA